MWKWFPAGTGMVRTKSRPSMSWIAAPRDIGDRPQGKQYTPEAQAETQVEAKPQPRG